MGNSKIINDVNAVIIGALKAKQFKQTIPITKIDSIYCDKTGVHIPFRKLGFLSLVDYLKTVPGIQVNMVDDMFYVTYMGTEHLQCTYNHIPTHQSKNSTIKTHQRKPIKPVTSINSSRSKKKMSKNIPECILTILRKLSRGISKSKLLKELNFEYQLNESLHSLNYHLTALRKLVIIKDGLVYENTKEGIELPSNVSTNSNKQLCLDNVVNATVTDYESVGKILLSDLKVNKKDKNRTKLIEVEVVESYSPSFFWIHLLKNKKEFNKMMITLGEYYEVNYQNHRVSTAILERGLNIAALYDGKWHRAIVKSVDPNSKVTVMFYDFGTISKCPSNEVYHLHRSFTQLPAQAIPCGLYSVAPFDTDKWPKRVRDLFNQWVYERPLWANIVEVDIEKKSMLVTLVDTSGHDDFIINDWLINNKMAKVKKTNCIDPENMNLYVNEFCEYYIDENGVYETIIPTTRHPESNGGTILSILNSPQSVDPLNKHDLHKCDWQAFKSQVRSKVDEFILLTIELFHNFTKNNTESNVNGIIQNFVGESLTDAILKLLFSFLNLDLQTQFTDTSVDSNESSAEIDDKQSKKNNNLTKESSVDVLNLMATAMQRETKFNKLEKSIQEVVTKFFRNKMINDLENLKIDKPIIFNGCFLDTNPFKDCFINDEFKEDETRPPPLPPRSFNCMSKLENIVPEASPLTNDSSKHWNPFV